jgi:hypothetical protein
MPVRNQGSANGQLLLAIGVFGGISCRRVPFSPPNLRRPSSQRRPTKLSSEITFLRFIESEWAQALFTKDFYHRLSMCFGHIAHVDRPTFYETWFTSDQDRLRFLEKTLKWPCWGDPEYTFSDVERAIQQEVRKRNYLARYQLRVAEAERAREMETLRRLEAKYRVPANRTDDAGAITADLAVVEPVRL